MAAAKMRCDVAEVDIALETEEPAYPASILNDPQTREQFRAVYIEPADELGDDVPTPGFWRRQFSRNSTLVQDMFDWHFSVILPVLCIAGDPGIFWGKHVFLGPYAPVAIPLSYAAVMGTMLWLLVGRRLGRLNRWLSGLFAVSAMASLAIGLVLFPFSFVGMLFIIGFLGYTPLLMSFSLWRNAVRAYRAADF